MNKGTIWNLWRMGTLLGVVLAVASYRYVFGIGFVPPNIAANLFARPWLAIHAGGAATALLLGSFQLLPNRTMHRLVGRLYVVACLVGGTGGLVMAFGTSAGAFGTASFLSLSLLWIAANLIGWRLAVRRRFAAHRIWMIRSLAMTFSAVTLRLYLPLFALAGVPFMDGYRISTVLSWTLNLVAAEIYLREAARRASREPKICGPRGGGFGREPQPAE